MATRMNFQHDVPGNILYIESRPPYRGQDEDDIEDGVIARRHPITDAVESVMILDFKRRIRQHRPLQLDIAVAPGRICGELAAAEFDALAEPGCPWLTIPSDAEIVELYIPGYAETAAPASA